MCALDASREINLVGRPALKYSDLNVGLSLQARERGRITDDRRGIVRDYDLVQRILVFDGYSRFKAQTLGCYYTGPVIGACSAGRSEFQPVRHGIFDWRGTPDCLTSLSPHARG